jgi:predicted MPP superfamily phosphohydrolase
MIARILRLFASLLLLAAALALWGFVNTQADPRIRRGTVHMTEWPAHAAPLRIALIGDIHAQGPDMPPERVARIVAQVNAEHPDLILLAGDYVGDRRFLSRHYPDAEIAAPLGKLTAPLGTWAVLGNHDHWRNHGSMAKALEAAGIHMLANSAARVGVLTLVGADDDFSRHADPGAVDRAAAALGGPVLLFTHSPDLVPRLSRRFGLVFAAHTHCGQIVLPFYGQIESSSHYGDRYRCGLIRENGRSIFVTGGLGTSVVPFRFGAPPDWWLITVGGR